MAALPLKTDSKFIEIPDNHHWFWYMKDDSPWLELRNEKGKSSITTYGDVRTWIEENTNGKVFIQFGDSINKERTESEGSDIYDDKIILLFDDPADYMAFKIVFPKLCRV